MAAIASALTIAHCVYERAQSTPEHIAFRWFNDFDRIDTRNWTQLHARAAIIAAAIRERLLPRANPPHVNHVVLCLPQGLDFIEAIFGVFYAACTAVPTYPPDSARTLPRFLGICDDAQASLIVTTRALAQKLEKFGGDIARLPLLYIDDIAHAHVNAHIHDGAGEITADISLPRADQLALLQYTSGTTSAPKGVMISHTHLLENERAASLAYRIGDNPHLVSWLPFYHDLGLMGGIFFPVYNGIPATLLSPATFLRNPATWLRVISETRATISGGPNFAFELCAARITDDVLATLDLSSWQTAVCGAEMIRQPTVDKFIQRFARAGFAPASFCGSYGMAETTLYVASANYEGAQFAMLEGGHTAFANCGRAQVGEVIIVDAQTQHRLGDDCIGEIWIRTPSVAHGYWRQEELSRQTFNATLADDNGVGYFRSGDLGFMREGNLYVTGRLKELIIVRGKNYSPQEIEIVALNANLAFGGLQCAAFSIDADVTEQLVVVQEVQRRALNEQTLENLEADIRLALRSALAVEADHIVLVKKNSLPRTSSGKLQRLQIKALYQARELDVLAAPAVELA